MTTIGHVDRALTTLKTVFGYDAFRPLQREIVDTILGGRDAFVLLPTGGGKSLCYQLPALLMDGTAVVVSPLIALMKDQVDKLRAMGVAATYVNSSLESREIARRQEAVARGEVKLLYVAPERLVMSRFLDLLQASTVSLFAIDEAHCISEWGHDFRPEYRELRRIRELFPRATLASFTATATPRVQADIVTQLGLETALTFRGSFNRPNLYYAVRPKQAAYDQLVAYLRTRGDASGIVYCQSRATTESLAERLQVDGFSAAAYHAGLENDERRVRQEAFVRDDVRVMVATIAFGMGIDKPDVRFVIHHDLPRNLEGFYQESGRAGRDGEPSECILFYSYADAARLEHFLHEKSGLEREVAERQLKSMVDWADGSTCRRQALLAYFEETLDGQDPERCCDVCTSPPEASDCTIPAQMFLSCVKRTRERFGAQHVIDVLRGKASERTQRLDHDKLSTWAIGKDRSDQEWWHIARELQRTGYVRVDAESYNAWKVTPKGEVALTRREPIMLAKPRPRPETRRTRRAVADAGPEAPPVLFERLRALRKRLADERGLPPYVVFHDSVLRDLASRRPRTLGEMRAISGVGDRKLQDYGAAFLAAIAEHDDGQPARVVTPAGRLL